MCNFFLEGDVTFSMSINAIQYISVDHAKL